MKGLELKIVAEGRSLRLNITVRRISELRPHEETVPRNLNRLLKLFSTSAYQRNPILVDSESGLILDGTHRWAAMKLLGYKWILVCELDYHSPLVELDRWGRLYQLPPGLNVDSLCRRFGFNLASDVDKRALVAIAGDSVYVYRAENIWKAYAKLREVERKLVEAGLPPPSYTPGADARFTGKGRFLLLPPLPTKQEVIETALQGRVLPPKSTRHIVPARPLGLNVPLKLLKRESLDPDLVAELLRQKNPLFLNPPVNLDREYQEMVLYFV